MISKIIKSNACLFSEGYDKRVFLDSQHTSKPLAIREVWLPTLEL